MTIRAIETTYRGYKMRSRLEARWAVFFDALGARWEYEPEGFVLEDGVHYLPDFWLPDLNLWVEIKGAEPTHEERQKCHLLALGGNPVALVSGSPGHSLLRPDLAEFSYRVEGFWGYEEPKQDFAPYPHYKFHYDFDEPDFLSLYNFLITEGYPLPVEQRELTGPARRKALIDMDRLYFTTRYKREANHRRYGVSIAGLVWDITDRGRLRLDTNYSWPQDKRLLMALNAARAARFEHGASG